MAFMGGLMSYTAGVGRGIITLNPLEATAAVITVRAAVPNQPANLNLFKEKRITLKFKN
jgi:hypothetical protein